MNINQIIEEYVAYKQSLGLRFHSPAVKLRAFAKSLDHPEIEKVTPEAVRSFLDGGKHIFTSDWFAKYSAIGPFFRYARTREYMKDNVLPLIIPKQAWPFKPYIYSVEDMQKLLHVANNRHRGVWHIDLNTMRVLLLLLYGSGLRISEALNLLHSDVDLDQAILTIRETKFFKTRLVPVGTELAEVLRSYFRRKWSRQECKPDLPFFVTQDRQPLNLQTTELTYKRIREEALVSRADRRYQPRLHDLRHTFAVTRVLTWYRQGENVQRLLPHLSTYLGHVRIQSTTRYLTLTAELLEEASSRFGQYAEPEMRND
jgi:site-specific recombinase XerD